MKIALYILGAVLLGFALIDYLGGGADERKTECLERRTQMLARCEPGCVEAPSPAACLNDCALERFGRELPRCDYAE